MVLASSSSLSQIWPQKTFMLFQHAFLSLANAVIIAWNALPSPREVTLAYPTMLPPP